jgi:hypothetical protein
MPQEGVRGNLFDANFAIGKAKLPVVLKWAAGHVPTSFIAKFATQCG